MTVNEPRGSALDLIGDTPLVEISRAYRGPGRILAKAEYLQPGGSMKDRNGLWVLRRARKGGRLAPGQTVVEMTSGNMGAGLAVACACLDHPFIAVMSEGNSPARARMMEAFGAQVIRAPQVTGAPGKVTNEDIEAAKSVARELAAARDAFYVDQWANEACVAAHYEGTGPEIWRQTGGALDAFVMVVGSAATYTGVAKFLKEQNPDILCTAVEPEGAEALAGKPIVKRQHLLQGTGYAHIPGRWRPELMDLSITVTDQEAEDWRRRLGAREGHFVGYSSAANVCASAKLLQSGRLARDAATVVTLLCDTGLKYGA